MEAKGCAKSMIWKNARRYFYWRLRGRLARERAIVQMSKANPYLSYESLTNLLEELLEGSTEPRALAEQLEKLDLESTLTQLGLEGIFGKHTTFAMIEHTLREVAPRRAWSPI